MPKMLTVDDRFEAIVADVSREVRADKMQPYQEPDPTKPAPAEEKPGQSTPAEEKPTQEK
ncbi:hypothetical protein [Nocardiopsis sp. ATB16-24]|uniref:hypothetical protein n=1 Tax=Nocardiopsis sp. ATB16-24 TaxID=3019555 RepID=UPI002553651D|nr:hypothetical protein [Nocardiopsis sp. ATB16-24]